MAGRCRGSDRRRWHVGHRGLRCLVCGAPADGDPRKRIGGCGVGALGAGVQRCTCGRAVRIHPCDRVRAGLGGCIA